MWAHVLCVTIGSHSLLWLQRIESICNLSMLQDIMIKLLYRIARHRCRGRYFPILIYHRVLPKADCFRPSEPTVDQFEKQMRFIQQNFDALTLSEAVEKLGRGELSDRAISITFDDGYKDNYENAAPILNKLGLSATFLSLLASWILDACGMIRS